MMNAFLRTAVAAIAAVGMTFPSGGTQAGTAGREGEIVPFFKTRDARGNTFDLKSVARNNNAVVLFFWHSYKTMSIREMNFLNDMYRFYNLYGMEIIGVESGGKDRPGVIEELNKLAIIGTEPVYTIVGDPGGSVARQYRVEEIPETFIIGRGGTVLYHLAGFRDGDRLGIETKLKEILGLLPAPPAVSAEEPVAAERTEPPRRTAVSIDPIQQQLEKCSYFGKYYLNLGDLDKALQYYGQCVEIDPADVSMQLKIGEVYAKRKDYERAREAWEEVLALDPGNSEARALIRKLVRGEF